MKKSFAWMMTAILLCGITALYSCSSDDKYSSDVKIQFEPGRQEMINSIMQSVKADMEAVNFQELAPLANALKDGSIKIYWNEIDSVATQQIVTGLQSLLDGFFDSETPRTYNKTWQLANLSKTLQLAINMGMAFEKNDDNQYVGNRNYSHAFDVKVNDSLTYNITFGADKSTGVNLVGFDNAAHRTLTIDKNGTPLLNLDVNHDFDVSREGMKFNATQLNSGSLDYKDMKFSLQRTRTNLSSIVSNLVYSKGGSEIVGIKMIGENDLSLEKLLSHNVLFKGQLETSIRGGLMVLDCDVANMNKFYMAGLGLAKMAILGSTKEKCQQQIDSLNAVISSKLLIDGDEQGLLYFEPMVSDSTTNVYRPELILQTYPLEDNNKIIVKDFIKMFGLSFEDMINALIGD